MSRSASNSSALLAALALAAVACAADSGSLWPVGRGERSMFADRKAGQVGDILTIVVSEATTATSALNKSSTRASTIEDSVVRFIFDPASSRLGTHNGALPATNVNGSASYSGGGSVNNTQTIAGRTSVLVTDVLPNGNLVIQGVRVVTFSGESQYVVLHGIVRPDDISSANTVFSGSVAEARVEYVNQGSLTDAQKRGWLAKLYEKLRMF